MVDFKRLSSRAKDLVEKRGGTDSLKQDAEQLRDIAKGKGSVSDKAKAAMAAIKEPGDRNPSAAGTSAPQPQPAEKERADEKVGRERRGKHAHAEKQGRKGGGGAV